MNKKEIGSYLLKALIAAGADKADCNVYSTRVDELNIDNGNINLLRSIFTTNISMKAIKDHKCGSISINSSDKEALDKAVADCMEATEAAMVEEAEDIAELTENGVLGSEAQADLDMLYYRLDELVKDTAKSFPKIILNELHASFHSGSRLHMNTNGVEMEELYHAYHILIEFSARDQDTSSSISEYDISCQTLDKPLLEIGNLSQVLKQMELSIYPKPLEGKFEGTLLLMPDVLNQLLHTMQGLLLSDEHLIDETSQWKDSLGKQVAAESFTLSCNFFDKDLVTSGSFITHDGYRASDVTVIDHGVLQSFLISRFGSRKTGRPRSANYGGFFTVEPGEQSLEEIIASIDKGILIGALSGNRPDISGEVTGVAKSGFLIEKGKIKESINETMISCNLLALLKNIRAISKEQICNGYYKLPYIAFDGVVISGK
jgi:PmbA protein